MSQTAAERGPIAGAPPEGISEEDYLATMLVLSAVARQVADLPLEVMLETIDRAESLGPILHPTAFRESGDGLRDQRDLLEAFQGGAAAVERIRERAS